MQISKQLGWPLEPSRSGFLPDSVKRWTPFKETNTQLDRFKKKFEIGLIANIDDKLLGQTRRHFRPTSTSSSPPSRSAPTSPIPRTSRSASAASAARRAGCTSRRSYYYDVEPCIKAKVPVIWVNRHKEQLDSSQKKPTAEVKTLLEAAKLLGAA